MSLLIPHSLSCQQFPVIVDGREQVARCFPRAQKKKRSGENNFSRYTFNSISRNGVCRVAKYFRRWKPAASGHTDRVIGEKGESSKELGTQSCRARRQVYTSTAKLISSSFHFRLTFALHNSFYFTFRFHILREKDAEQWGSVLIGPNLLTFHPIRLFPQRRTKNSLNR